MQSICFMINDKLIKLSIKLFQISYFHKQFSFQIPYVDFAPYHMMTEVSLVDLQSRLESKVTFKNFRPNFVISGTEPYEEDIWETIYIGGVKFRNYVECPR